MDPRFNSIKQAFQASDRELKESFRFVVRDTAKGIWGPSDLDVVFGLFQKIGLQRAKSFLDIGCGDGRVVLVASLFTEAAGIEIDADLVNKGNEISRRLKLNAKLLCGDFFAHDFSRYDMLFVNPDTGFYNGLEDKLLKEMRHDAVLLVYNNIFLPRFLQRGATHWIRQVPVTEFFRSPTRSAESSAVPSPAHAVRVWSFPSGAGPGAYPDGAASAVLGFAAPPVSTAAGPRQDSKEALR